MSKTYHAAIFSDVPFDAFAEPLPPKRINILLEKLRDFKGKLLSLGGRRESRSIAEVDSPANIVLDSTAMGGWFAYSTFYNYWGIR